MAVAGYRVLATDYDETLATAGRVERSTLHALEAVRASGRRLVLVTGRRLDDLMSVFPATGLFDAIVGENGAILSLPGRPDRLLAPPPPRALIAALHERSIPHVAGKVVVASWAPHGPEVARVLHELALPLTVVPNKEAVMILPSGIDKRSGLAAALEALGASMQEAVAIGDAENDVAMLRGAGCGAAVANALPAVLEAADVVATRPRGAGVQEIVKRFLAGDLPASGRG